MRVYSILFICVTAWSMEFPPWLGAPISQVAFSQTAIGAANGVLPDTGQTVRFTKTFGEDSDFKGNAPAYTDNGDGTVTDKVTGLMWQKQDGGEMTWERAKEFASHLELGGHHDWRLPTSIELFSIMNHGLHGPAMDTTYFSKSEARYWWTNSFRADDSSKVWVVNTGGGIGAHAKSETISAGGDRPIHVRCVRGAAAFQLGPKLRDNGDGTVTDQITGLIWQKVGLDQLLTWEEALNYCETLELAGRDDWRVPNIKELRSLSDDGKVSPSLDKDFFPNALPAVYWSATTQSNRPERAWFVDFVTGLVSYLDKAEKSHVLAVRGGNVIELTRNKPQPDPHVVPQTGGDSKTKKIRRGKDSSQEN